MIDSSQSSTYGQTPIKQIRNGVWQLDDHIGGFDSQGYNKLISSIDPAEIHTEYIFPDWIKQRYPQHQFKFNADLMIQNNSFSKIIGYEHTMSAEPDNFLCCFNRAGHSGRQWLVERLFSKGLFNSKYCSKGFAIPQGKFDAGTHNFKREKFLHGTSEPTDILFNLKDLSPLIKSSFINLVSETVPESYVPFPTEKFLFPILNKRLWVAYAPPGYHEFITKVLGFRLYDDFF